MGIHNILSFFKSRSFSEADFGHPKNVPVFEC